MLMAANMGSRQTSRAIDQNICCPGHTSREIHDCFELFALARLSGHAIPLQIRTQNHPTTLPKQLTPPNAALIPVSSTSGPYSLAYNPLPPTSPIRNNASLIGPQATFPIPLPAASTENTIIESVPCSLPSRSFIMPGYTVE